MDIRVVITRSIIYFLLIALVTLTLTFTTIVSVQYFGETQTNRVIVALIAALLIVFGLEPLKRVISRATDKIFFKARIDYEGVLRRLSEIISLEIDIDKLVTTLTQTLAKELKIKQSIIILARPDHKPGRDVYEVRTEVHPHTPRIVLQPEDPLIKYFHEEQKMTVLEALERKIDDTADEKERAKLEGSRKEIEKIGAAVVAPVVAQNRLNAVLVLGPKLSGDSYSDEDLKLIEVLGPQIGSAIEKSKLYEEVKGFTKTLQNKVDQATSELRERNKFLLALQRVTNLITRSLDIKKVSQQIVNSVSSELGYIGGLLILIDDSGQRVYLEAITETPLTKKALKLLPKPISEYKGDLKTDKTLGIKAILEGKIQFGDHLDEFLSPPVPKLALRAIEKVIKVKSVVGVPIYSEDQIIGVIEVVLPKPKSEITKREIEMMKSLADQTGIVARNLRLFERIRKTNEELAEANERLKQLDQAKTEFVSIASHQLRTPMTGIMGYLSMLTAGDFGKLPPKHFKILTDLLGESQRMIRLINIFLNVSKIEAGKFELNKDNTVQLEDLIESEVKEVEKIANAKNIKLEFKKPKEKMPQIHADPDKLKDVMLNLIDNAVKYTSEGSITISVEKMVNEIKISVKDTGVGIKSEEAKQLFAKFSRGSGIARINPDGSGLGLFIAKKIIEGHEGQIWVESKGEGKGSTFSFTLPIK
jgi:signal transduction histidine kinase